MVRAQIFEWILKRKSWVYYLTPIDAYGKLREQLQIPIDDRFYAVATRYMNAYMEKGDMPPEQIAPAIFNMLDDYAAGREVVIRTGDYVVMQNFLRANKDA